MTKQKQPCMSSSTPSTLSMQKDSHTISKLKPKIRIIHIFAPEIIKTDVANFRELVQRLTGKPTSNDHHNHKKGCKNKLIKHPSTTSSRKDEEEHNQKKVVETKSGFVGFGMFKEEADQEDHEMMMMWNNNGANSGGFLGGFSDLECNYGFIQELGEQLPLLPHHVDC